MGGGTGTGAAPVIAEMARVMGALTIGIVTKPFLFEGKKRMRQAEQGLAELKRAADTVIVVPNERLLSVVGKGVSVRDALKKEVTPTAFTVTSRNSNFPPPEIKGR